MTPKQKAEELINKYLNASFNCKDCDMPYCDIKCTMLSKREAKVCALIAIDEIIEHINELDDSEWYFAKKQYLYDVKQEIEKL